MTPFSSTVFSLAFMEPSTGLHQFGESLRKYTKYPENLAPHNALPYNSEAYVKLIDKHEPALFCSEQNPQCQLRFWEHEDQLNGEYRMCKFLYSINCETGLMCQDFNSPLQGASSIWIIS